MSKWRDDNLKHIINELEEYESKSGFVDEALDYYCIRQFILNYLEQRNINLENEND